MVVLQKVRSCLWFEKGGEEVQCGWLKDRWGVSWQIVPQRMYDYMDSPDPALRKRVFTAMLGMVKFDVSALDAAAKGETA